MADCSKTEVYIREAERMCNFYSKDLTEQCCDDCPFDVEDCFDYIISNPQKAVEIANRWTKERMEKDGEPP